MSTGPRSPFVQKLYKLVLLFLAFSLLALSCRQTGAQHKPIANQKSYTPKVLRGFTMGTTYVVKGEIVNPNQIEQEITEMLANLNDEVSTYIDSSRISLFNRSNSSLRYNPSDAGPAFQEIMKLSQEISEKSSGYFDPTVMPLVNYWGFGYSEKRAVLKIDSTKVREMLAYIGIDKVSVTNDKQKVKFTKQHPKLQLDFSAIAKGYAVDMISKLFDDHHIQNYLIDIGGEQISRGVNDRGKVWTIAITTPDRQAKSTDAHTLLKLEDQAIATSGNYRIFYEVKGEFYGHTISPKTGFPEVNDMLSASIIANTCAEADGYATAVMAMGYEKAKAMLDKIPNIHYILIYIDNNQQIQTDISTRFQSQIVEL